MSFIPTNSVLILLVLAAVEGVIAVHLSRNVRRLEERLRIAAEAAEDAARAAALAAPGGIDPEVVIDLIRQGRKANLDTIHELMDAQAAAEQR